MYSFTETDKSFFEKNRYIIIDGFLDDCVAQQCQHDILTANSNMWDRYDNCFEQKYTYRDKNDFPKNIKNLYDYLTKSLFINELNNLTGLNLMNETDKLLWGIHMFNNNDKLDIHVDAGRHVKTGLIKAITFGLYLSHNWTETNGGHLEFWDGDSAHIEFPKIYNCRSKVLPVFYRCVIFENNNNSWHGSPEPCICKNDEKRIFLTLSYFINDTAQPDAFLNLRKKAYFVKRPDDPNDEEKDKMRALRANPETCKFVYNTKKNNIII
jgi:Rps23 Pro-64 3,4-dihydroxylase Tpa1-like proline 4-hydroxylase